jgi:hypothetical protein
VDSQRETKSILIKALDHLLQVAEAARDIGIQILSSFRELIWGRKSYKLHFMKKVNLLTYNKLLIAAIPLGERVGLPALGRGGEAEEEMGWKRKRSLWRR